MRGIIYDPEFDKAVELLGGYLLVDEALEPILDGLYRNPYGFRLIENDWIRIRYAVTKATGALPSLVVLFSIEANGDVILRHVEELVEG